jgi:hypothetical protein
VAPLPAGDAAKLVSNFVKVHVQGLDYKGRLACYELLLELLQVWSPSWASHLFRIPLRLSALSADCKQKQYGCIPAIDRPFPRLMPLSRPVVCSCSDAGSTGKSFQALHVKQLLPFLSMRAAKLPPVRTDGNRHL